MKFEDLSNEVQDLLIQRERAIYLKDIDVNNVEEMEIVNDDCYMIESLTVPNGGKNYTSDGEEII